MSIITNSNNAPQSEPVPLQGTPDKGLGILKNIGQSVRSRVGSLRDHFNDLRMPSHDTKAGIFVNQKAEALQSTRSIYTPKVMASDLTFTPDETEIQQLLNKSAEHIDSIENMKLPGSITDDQIIGLIEKGYLNNLLNLDLSECTQLTDKALEQLSKLAQLQYLNTTSQFKSV